ncbi:hypothetical protein [Aestuariivirga sp.]|uniref:hypothetical protein n=1 Tax=Aestuariivirga sp. TaxID=2650926 RepID=UPI0039E3B44B
MPAEEEILDVDPRKYPGGIGLWGAVPPVYSTAAHNFSDLGIHVHARATADSPKEIDSTFRAVRIELAPNLFEKKKLLLGQEEAVYYMASQVFGYEMSEVLCSHCGHNHLDRDFFAVNPHKRHLCSGCGRHFSAAAVGVGNPLVSVRQYAGFDKPPITHRPHRSINIEQSQYVLGIELWGSNPAILWTAQKSEEEGIHVHCYSDNPERPCIDETFDDLTIDGHKIDEHQLRLLMAQLSLPHLSDRVVALSCPECTKPHFDLGKLAHTPHSDHTCEHCGQVFATKGPKRNVVSNPTVATLELLEKSAPRPRKIFENQLPKET